MAETITVGEDSDDVDINLRRRGDIKILRFTWPDGTDLSTRTWAAQARGDLDEGPLVSTLTVDASQAATSVLTVTLPHSQSKLLATPHPEPGFPEVPGQAVYFWDLQGTAIADPEDVWTPFGGRINVGGDVTTDEDA